MVLLLFWNEVVVLQQHCDHSRGQRLSLVLRVCLNLDSLCLFVLGFVSVVVFIVYLFRARAPNIAEFVVIAPLMLLVGRVLILSFPCAYEKSLPVPNRQTPLPCSWNSQSPRCSWPWGWKKQPQPFPLPDRQQVNLAFQFYDLLATMVIGRLRKPEMLVHHTVSTLMCYFLMRDW